MGVKNRAVMLFCFSSSFPFLRNLQPLLNGNGKFGKWRGGVGWAAASLSLTSPIWTGEGRGRLASLQATPNPSQLLAVQGQRLFSPKCVFLVGLRKHFFFHCHILHQLLTPRLLSLSRAREAGGGEWFSFRRLCFAGETCKKRVLGPTAVSTLAIMQKWDRSVAGSERC